MPLQSGLYVVGTPIGNLEDITFRAVRILRQASVILAEARSPGIVQLSKHNLSNCCSAGSLHVTAEVVCGRLAECTGKEAPSHKEG